ncbi:MAG TPA: cyclic peptide export ABC transporter [Candidatus Binatia bacterium]|nr:cyclic peptide export ABC transporter [Candidatus Binatia bacterium]
MSFLQLVRREMHGSLPKLLFMSAIGGISTAAILAGINAGLQGNTGLWAPLLFLIALFLFINAQYFITITTTAEIEAIIHKIRLRLMDHIRHSELLAIEGIGRSRIFAAITGDTAILTQASNTLCFTVQGTVLICFVAIYVAFLSIAAILTTIVIVSIAATIFHLKNRRLVAEKQRSAEWERRLFDRLTDFLDGFKEIRLNNARSNDLFDDAVDVSRTAANIKIKSQAETFKLIVTSQISMYVLLGAVVFVAPQFSSDLGGAALTKTTTALMFIVGACFGLVQSIPVLVNANAAADRIEQLEMSLRAAVSSKQLDSPMPKRFGKIEMRNIEFRYVDIFSDVSFKIGPIDFDLQSGELVFITGGNGSGKSTFLRVLSGLYPADSGEILLDGVRIDENTRDTYRNLMSAIFFDYHLFQRLYGIPKPAPGEVDRLLAQFRLGDKTGLTDGQFRTLDLSGGQRRRLALIVSLLEKRPILLLDEWTAEQDPEFRRKFYDELLPDMIKAGATIVVITHDDRYLDELNLPARRIRMDEGRIVEQRSAQRR